MKEAGFTVDEQVMDWGTVLARRGRREGWSAFAVYANGTDMLSPLTNFYVANTCADYPGWDCDPRVKAAIEAFAAAPDGAGRQRAAAEIQALCVDHVPSVMWGQFTIPAGYRTHLTNLIQSSYPMFWQVERR